MQSTKTQEIYDRYNELRHEISALFLGVIEDFKILCSAMSQALEEYHADMRKLREKPRGGKQR